MEITLLNVSLLCDLSGGTWWRPHSRTFNCFFKTKFLSKKLTISYDHKLWVTKYESLWTDQIHIWINVTQVLGSVDSCHHADSSHGASKIDLSWTFSRRRYILSLAPVTCFHVFLCVGQDDFIGETKSFDFLCFLIFEFDKLFVFPNLTFFLQTGQIPPRPFLTWPSSVALGVSIGPQTKLSFISSSGSLSVLTGAIISNLKSSALPRIDWTLDQKLNWNIESNLNKVLSN